MLNSNTLELASSLGERLLSKNWTITTAESCTGGGIGYALTSKSGSSAWLNQGYITYSNQAKTELVNVTQDALESNGAVSQSVVEQMAEGAAKAAKAEVSIAVSGIAGPDGGSAQKPVGTVWFGFYVNGDIHTTVQVFSGDRHQVRQQTIDFALQHCIYLIDQ